MKKAVSMFLIFVASVLLLAGCNWDGSSGTANQTKDLDFHGVAAIGAPAAGYTVYLESADGQLFQSVADGNGGYTISAKGIEAPFLLWFEMADGEKIYAVTFEDGVVNLNAITSALTKAAYTLSGNDSDDELNPMMFDEEKLSSAEAAVTQFMQPVLEMYGVDTESFDPLQMPDFVADGFEVDGILDDFYIEYDSVSEEVIIKLKNSEVPIGSLDMDSVKNAEENVDDINTADLTELNSAIVEKAANSITFTGIAGENTSANNVITALNLFTRWRNGTAVEWTSNSEAVSPDGTVTGQDKDVTVILTATVTKGNASAQKSFTVLVKASTESETGGDSSDENTGGDTNDGSGETSGDDTGANSDQNTDVNSGDDSGTGTGADTGADTGDNAGGDQGGITLGEFTAEDMLGNNRSADNVTFNLNLMTELEDGTEVSWESSDPEYIDAEGKLLKRPTAFEGTKTVTLSASRTKETLSGEDTFTVTIPAIIPQRISSGSYIKEDGTLWQTGEASRYMVGNGYYNYQVFTQEETSSEWLSVSSSSVYTLAIKSDGTLWVWGLNYSHNISESDETFIEAVQIGTDDDWTTISVGMYSEVSAAIKSDGTLWLFGSSNYGMIPSEEEGTAVTIPVQESTMANDWVDVKVGYYYVTALKTDGTIWSWGSNYYGGFGTAVSGEPTSAPVQESTMATDWVAIDAYSGTTAIKKDGTLWFWGGTSFDVVSATEDRSVSGRSGPSFRAVEAPMQEPSLSTDWVKPIFAGNIGGLKSDGTIWSFGSGGACNLGNGLCEDSLEMVQESTQSTDWTDIKGSGSNMYAIASDGSLWGWGSNRNGELGTGISMSGIYEPKLYTKKTFVKMDSGAGSTSCGIEEDGNLWCTDDHSVFRQVNGQWSDVVTDGYSVWGIKTDGTLWFWGTDMNGLFTGAEEYTQYDEPIQIGLDTWKQVAIQRHDGASNSMMGIKTDGTLWAIGNVSTYDGTSWISTTTSDPILMSGEEWSKVIIGHKRLTIKADGTLWAWNNGWSSGIGETFPESYPVQVGTDTWKDVAVAREESGIGIKSDGKLYGWGYSYYPFLFDEAGYDISAPTALSNTDSDWEKVAIGYGFFSAVKSDGSVYSAGLVSDYPSPMQGLGDDTGSILTFRKVDGTYSDVFFMQHMVYAIGTDGEGYIWGQPKIQYSEPSPIKIME